MPTEYLDSNGLDTLWQQIRAADNVVCNSDHTIHEYYKLPTFTASADINYDILTSKSAVTIAQGGTGATSASAARTNLGLGTMATASASDYLLLTGGTLTGNVTHKHSSWDVTSPPASDSNWDIHYTNDKNGKGITFHRVWNKASGIMGYEFGVRRQGSSASADTIWNTIGLFVAADGTNTVSVSNSAAWRTALGLGTMATQSSSSYLLLSGGTLTGNLWIGGTSTGDKGIRVYTSMNKNTTPSSYGESDKFQIFDAADTKRLAIRTIDQTDGRQGIGFTVKRDDTIHGFNLYIKSDGTRSVYIDDAAAWRSGLGLGTMATQASSSYLPLSGGTLTGNLYGTYFIASEHVQVRKTGDVTPFILKNTATTPANRAYIGVTSANRFAFREYVTDGGVYEFYNLPAPNASANAGYDILTSKSAVTIAQGGTGATDAATARTNLAVLGTAGGTITGQLIVQGSSDSIYAVHGVACADYEDSYFKKRMNAAAFLVGGHTTDDKFRGGLAMNSTNNRIYFRAHKTSGNSRGDIFQFPAPTNTSTSSDVTYFIPIMQYGYAAANTSTNITLNRTGTWLMITGHNSTAGSNELYIVRTGANIFKVSGGTSSTMTSISISNATITLKSSNAINIYFIFLPHGTND